MPRPKPPNRPTIRSIIRLAMRTSSLAVLTNPRSASPTASGPTILRPDNSMAMPCMVCGSIRAASCAYSAPFFSSASIIIGSRPTSLSLA
ncbi:MAG: hypothetical protein KF731_03030 [Thauera sp.]|nr:hypothetical protein [Thauera sp.]